SARLRGTTARSSDRRYRLLHGLQSIYCGLTLLAVLWFTAPHSGAAELKASSPTTKRVVHLHLSFDYEYLTPGGGGKRNETTVWVNEPKPASLPTGMTHHTYFSKSMGHDVGYCIYLPPGYEKADNRRYPVIYDLHGN